MNDGMRADQTISNGLTATPNYWKACREAKSQIRKKNNPTRNPVESQFLADSVGIQSFNGTYSEGQTTDEIGNF